MGGYFADKIIGYRYAVAVGALLMTLGHGAMALETPFFIYTGLTLLVFGSGFFKPNMTSIISEMYKGKDEKKDGAYTIFYMGVNAGAFLGILLCGYLGEKVGWSIGFGLADEKHQGQYQGVWSLSWGLGGTLGPAFVTLMAITLGQRGWIIMAVMFLINGILMHRLVTRSWLSTPA